MRAVIGSALVLALAGIATGCSALRRDSLKAIDAAVQKEPRLERARAPGGFRLGPYTIVQRELREHAVDSQPVATIEGPRRPTWRYELALAVTTDGGAPWSGRCTGTRQANIDSDFGAVAGIANDNVSIACDFEGDGARWRFTTAGRLDGNLRGELARADASATPAEVEIILWIRRVKLIPRHLAEPVAQVRRGQQVVAAMVLSRPEWAWVRRAERAEVRSAAMITLAALRLLPLGFDE